MQKCLCGCWGAKGLGIDFMQTALTGFEVLNLEFNS